MVISDETLTATQPPQKQGTSGRILVVHASVGSGHRSAAFSIAEALEEIAQNPPAFGIDSVQNLEVEVLDILDFGSIKFDGDKAASMFTGITRPIYDLTWRFTFTGRLLWGGGTVFSRVMFPRFSDYVERTQPLAIVCTHIVAANCAVGARAITKQSYPVISVPTDYETEGFWPHKDTDLFCVATEAMAETLRPRKVPEDKILLTGIPTRKGYRHQETEKEALDFFGLPHDKKVVLALAGAHLPTPYIHFRNSLDELLPQMKGFKDLHLVIVAGKDKAYARHLRQGLAQHQCTNVTILDYTTQMAKLMAACDVVICKPGGLTVTECLCAQTPMILIGQAYGQEKANVLMLTSSGAALHVTTTRELTSTLASFEQHPQVLDALLTNARVLRRPQASIDIAKATLELAQLHQESKPRYKPSFLRLYWGKKPAHTR